MEAPRRCLAFTDNCDYRSTPSRNDLKTARGKENCILSLDNDISILKTREKNILNSNSKPHPAKLKFSAMKENHLTNKSLSTFSFSSILSSNKSQYTQLSSKSMVESHKDLMREITPSKENNDHDSEEMFKTVTTTGGKRGKSFVDSAFKNFDDMYANFSSKKMLTSEKDFKTPKRTYSVVDRSLVHSSEYLFVPTPGSKDNFVPSEVKSARRQAMIEGHNDVREILKNAGIQASTYFSVLYSSHKKKTVLNKSKPLTCSTPVNSPIFLDTPKINNSNRIKTPIPVSGIRELATSTPCGIPQFRISSITPKSPCFRGSISPNISPVASQCCIPPEVKSSILPGVTCFVDVRTDKENHTEAVKIELISLGAKIEKNFTKKVTHVVFKEGRVSTYLKAKKTNIPLVSILWIEACKNEVKAMDPELYPPLQMEKYENILPFQTIKKRRLRFLHTTVKTNNHVVTRSKKNATKVNSSVKSTSPRKAITDLKAVSRKSSLERLKEKHCTKKLDFGQVENNEDPGVLLYQVDSEDDVTTDSECFDSLKSSKWLRRKSAPANLISSKRKRKRQAVDPNRQENKENVLKGTGDPDERINVLEKDLNCEENIVVAKKRKLFNPNIMHLNSEATQSPSPSSSIAYPYPEGTEKKRARTKLSSMRKRMPKKLVTCKKESKARRGLMALLEQEETNVFLSCSRRSSISLFVEPKPSQPQINKHPPTIVFTSIPPSELKEYEKMIDDLGIFDVEPTVSDQTTHIVSNGPRRTVNLLKGIVRGCWVLSIEWIVKSKEAGKWLNEEQFEMASFSPAILHCRLERQAFGSGYCMDLFSSSGGIYVSRNTKPAWKDLVELIRLCRGHIITQARAASIIVGGKSSPSESIVRVKETWVLDSITFNTLLDVSRYKILKDNGS